ncbi:uncharacterized protein DUF5018 [Mucilaginibacter gracilis]|uniref:Uncharacterized protein DUF5018 n=1 Tax=Mucilaginibacter gracilis TaxID=423350 RepID=A0A495JAM5_9SPHI|nr:DUF5018 domain-containing protein [Mucilaginibacter gracilis]RKR85771.1 uncharacterized protein DUF5018 [Mucilaginibacter gracilis]
MKNKFLLFAVFILAVGILIWGCSSKSNDAQPTKSSAKTITSFVLAGFSPAVTGVVDEVTHRITLTIPASVDLTVLTPTVKVAEKATVSPASGAVQNFSGTVTYTVTAEDGSTQAYTVSVQVAQAMTQTIDCSNVPAVLQDLGAGVDYIIKCNITLSGSQVLTIKPGVTILFDGAATGITVTGRSALNMVGTAAKPIILQGKTNTQGSWTGIQMDSPNNLNQWEYVTVQNAGGGQYPAGLLIADDAYFLHNTQVSIKNCTFSNNKGYGIWDSDNGFSYTRTVFAAFQNNTFTGNSDAALNITMDAIGKLDAASHYAGNGQAYIELHAVNGLNANSTVQKLELPYLVVGSIELHQKMTISPGVTFQFYTDAGFNLDNQYRGSGTLIASGTASAPIRFVGYKSGNGIWLGLSLGNNDPANILDYCVVDGGGSHIPNASTACIGDTKGGINFYPSCSSWATAPRATNCTVTNSGGYGIIYKKGVTPNFAGNSYSGNLLANQQGL